VFWFHPLVWWTGSRLVEERERACDEHVLRVLGEPRAYAEAILNICTPYVEAPLACLSRVTGARLDRRIEEIMMNRTGLTLNFTRRAALVAAATVALGAPVVVGMIAEPVAAQSRQESQAKTTESVRAKEAALKDALFQLRNAIDEYHASKRQYPRRLDALVSDGYIKKIPTDPLTRRSDSWRTIASKPESNNPNAVPGIYDVKSASKAKAADGTKYSEW
jgi:hypothetical protein